MLQISSVYFTILAGKPPLVVCQSSTAPIVFALSDSEQNLVYQSLAGVGLLYRMSGLQLVFKDHEVADLQY